MEEIRGQGLMPAEVSSQINVKAGFEDLRTAILGMSADEPIQAINNEIVINPTKRIHFFAFRPTIDMMYKEIGLSFTTIDEQNTQLEYRFQQRNLLLNKIVLVMFTIIYGLIFIGLSLFGLFALIDGEGGLGVLLIVFGLFFLLIFLLVGFISLRRLTKKGQNKYFQKIYLKELVQYLAIIEQKRRQQGNM